VAGTLESELDETSHVGIIVDDQDGGHLIVLS
jgi:hypothetical protein